MAKKKGTGRDPDRWNTKAIIAQLRGSEDFKLWMEQAAKADRSSVAMFIERAMVQYAKSIGFNEAPPER